MSNLRALGAAVLAADCACCRQPMGWGRHGVCEICWSETAPYRGRPCELCGRDLPIQSTGRRCGGCIGITTTVAAAAAWGPYAGRLRDLIHALKYDGRFRLARPLGRKVAEALRTSGLEAAVRRSILVPVPLSRKRLSARGYNQSHLLAEEAARNVNAERRPAVVDALVRSADASPQAGLGRKERLKNPIGTYTAAPGAAERLKNRSVVLVDDVLTTGATAGECARVLLLAGAVEVVVAVVARTPAETGGAAAAADENHEPRGKQGG